MSSEFLRVQLAPLVLRAVREISGPDGLPTVSRVAEWAEEADLTRSNLRRAFNKGVELAWRTLLSGTVARAEGDADSVLAAALPQDMPRPADSDTIQRLVAGLQEVADDPPRVIPRSDAIAAAASETLDLEPGRLDAQWASATQEFVASFEETDAEEAIAWMPGEALLDTTLAGTLHYLAEEHPQVRTVLAWDAAAVRAAFAERAEELQQAGGHARALEELHEIGERLEAVISWLDRRLAPARTCWADATLFKTLRESPAEELPERVRGLGVLPQAGRNDESDGDESGDVVISVAPKRDARVAQGEAAHVAAATAEVSDAVPLLKEGGTAPDTEFLDKLDDEQSEAEATSTQAGVVVVGPSTSDTSLLRVDAGPRQPKPQDPFTEAPEAFEFRSGENDDEDEPLPPPQRTHLTETLDKLAAGTLDGLDELPVPVLDAVREVVLRKPSLADEAKAWSALFVEREPERYASAWRADLLARQRFDDDTELVAALAAAPRSTLALLPTVLSSEALRALLERLRTVACTTTTTTTTDHSADGENGSAANGARSTTTAARAREVLSRLLALRGAALLETVLHWVTQVALPEPLWPALATVLAQARRPSVLPPLHAVLDAGEENDAPEPLRRQVASLLVTLGDLERVQAVLATLPELATPGGLLKAGAWWHGDRAVPFARKMAQLPALTWIPEAWYDELARHIPAAAAALPEAEARSLMTRPDLPEPIREALEARVEAAESHLPPEANVPALVDLVTAEPELTLTEAWARLGPSQDARTLLAMLPAEPAEAGARDALSGVLLAYVREALDDSMGALFQQQERIHAGIVDAVEVLALWRVEPLLEVVPALLRQTPATRLARLCRALADYGEPAYSLLCEFLRELAATPEGHVLASRDGIADALVTALVETGGEARACPHLRELLEQWSDEGKLPSALLLAMHRHALEDGAPEALEAAVRQLAATTYPPLIAALAEGITRGRPAEAQPLLDHLAARYPGLDLRPARRVLAAGSVAAEPLRFAMRFTREPDAARLDEVANTLGGGDVSPERHVIARLAKGLVRLGSDAALRMLLEHTSPALAAYALQALAPQRQQELLAKVFEQQWPCPEPSKFVRAWLDTPGLDNLVLLKAFATLDPSGFQQPERLARRLPELVAAVANPERLDQWLQAVHAALTNEALPARLRQFALDGLLAGPVRQAAKVARALDHAVRQRPASERHAGERLVLQRIARWLTLLRTPESEEARLDMLPELEPQTALDVLEKMPDAVLQEHPELVKWLLHELPQALADEANEAADAANDDAAQAQAQADKLAAAQGRLLRNVPTERVAEQLWSKEVLDRAETALTALALGLPTFWRVELEHLQSRQFRSAPVFARVMETKGLAEGVMLYGLLSPEHASTAIPSGVLMAFLQSDAPRWMLTVLEWETRRAIYAELVGLAERNGQAWGLARTCRVLHDVPPQGQYQPPLATRQEITCSHCNQRFAVAFPSSTLDTVPATCNHCGTRLKLKNVPPGT